MKFRNARSRSRKGKKFIKKLFKKLLNNGRRSFIQTGSRVSWAKRKASKSLSRSSMRKRPKLSSRVKALDVSDKTTESQGGQKGVSFSGIPDHRPSASYARSVQRCLNPPRSYQEQNYYHIASAAGEQGIQVSIHNQVDIVTGQLLKLFDGAYGDVPSTLLLPQREPAQAEDQMLSARYEQIYQNRSNTFAYLDLYELTPKFDMAYKDWLYDDGTDAGNIDTWFKYRMWKNDASIEGGTHNANWKTPNSQLSGANFIKSFFGKPKHVASQTLEPGQVYTHVFNYGKKYLNPQIFKPFSYRRILKGFTKVIVAVVNGSLVTGTLSASSEDSNRILFEAPTTIESIQNLRRDFVRYTIMPPITVRYDYAPVPTHNIHIINDETDAAENLQTNI